MVEVSVILPCRNEEKTIKKCILQIKETFKKNNIDGEIIVSDSSSDSSYSVAKKEKVVIAKHDMPGYGIAIMKGIERAKGYYYIIGDADGTYDFREIPILLKELRKVDIVIGSRFKGKILKGAMPFLHRYVGNPFLSYLLNLFFKTRLSDAHSGFRGITMDAYSGLNLKTTGMEYASEMLIKAAKLDLRIREVPITYLPRTGISKLNSFSDGWRHLRFMLLLSPTYLFFYPGSVFFLIGIVFLSTTQILDLQYNQQLFGSFLTILGFQIVNLGFYARVFATHSGLESHDDFINIFTRWLSLERSLMIGLAMIILSGAMLLLTKNHFIIFTGLILGIQTLFSAFFISMMAVEKK